MPHLKSQQKTEPPWKEWDRKAQKEGLRHTVYYVNGDEYTGEWSNNLHEGKGTYKWKKTGAIYDGDFKAGKRCGFGTYSILVNGEYRKLYTGEWADNMRCGYGTQYYSETEYYEGQWRADKREGWGRMYYADGSVYEGEWFADKRHGQGLYKLANDNRYEGEWQEDKKHGHGKFFYLDTGQLLEGIWMQNTPKSGAMRDFSRASAPTPTQYPIQSLELAQPAAVLRDAEELHLGLKKSE